MSKYTLKKVNYYISKKNIILFLIN